MTADAIKTLGQLRICVPTLNRVERQIFVRNMPRELHPFVHWYAPAAECAELQRVWKGTNACPTTQEGHMGNKRQTMLDDSKAMVVMVDDDVRIMRAAWDSDKKQVKANGYLDATNLEGWVAFFAEMKANIRAGFGMVGVTYQSQIWQVSRRSFTHRVQGPTRLWGIYALNAKMARKFKFRFDHLRCMEDFDYNLQLLRSGVPTCAMTGHCWSQPGSNVDGGCSTYRTALVQKDAAVGLSERHSEYVKLVEKESGWGGGLEKRFDCRISWQKAAIDADCPDVSTLAPRYEYR